MSGGSPMGGVGLMRQRHSHGYSSGGEDLEDDACSRLRPQQPPLIELRRRWSEIVENIVWIVSATFIFYFGDGNSNFLFLIRHDHRVKRVEFYIGMVGIMLNAIFVLVAWKFRKSGEKLDISNSSALPFVALIGIISFTLLSFALWPIWSFLTLPLLFTLLITGVVTIPYIAVVTVPYIVVLTSKRPHQSDVLRID